MEANCSRPFFVFLHGPYLEQCMVFIQILRYSYELDPDPLIFARDVAENFAPF